jgi:hypothetical protein
LRESSDFVPFLHERVPERIENALGEISIDVSDSQFREKLAGNDTL